VESEGERTAFRTRAVLNTRNFTVYPLSRKLGLPYPIKVRVKHDQNPVQVQTWSIRGITIAVPPAFLDRLARGKQVQIEIRDGCYQCKQTPPPSRILRFLSDGLAVGLPAVRKGCATAAKKPAAEQKYFPRLK